MYSTSTAYKTEIKKPSRSFECKITIGDRIYNNSDIVNVVIDGNIQPSDGFMIGTTVSKTLDLTLINSGDTIYSTSQVKVEIGLKIGQTIEYIPMGLFNIDDIEKTDYTTKITAFDNMIKFESAYFSSLGDNPTLQQVVSELASKTGVQFTGSLPSYTVKKLEGFTCREIVGYVASICGGNAVITRDGKFTIVSPTDVSLSIDGSNYINYKREEVKYKVGKVTCKVGEEELSKGSLGTDSMELGFENPWITNNILQDIYNKLNGFNYLGYSMKWQGDLSLDVGDIVTVTDVKGVVRKHPVLAQKFNYTGGLTAEIGAKGENKNKNSFSSSGDTSKKINRMVTEVAIINKAFIDYAHINDADIVNLKAETAKIRLVEADVATINTVLAGTVNAVNINADNINAATGRIAILESGSATISQLNAANAKIATLESRAGVIDTLLAGNLTADNMKANLITAGTTLIADGSIASAKIISLSADKINAGKINTNLVSIQSSSGNMLISDNTIQIKDSTRVRVQIGKDASNDYNMYVWDSSGNLMFDATGLKASGIKTKIIRDDMVSDTANINATKIEKESLVTRINGATTLLLASKVKLDTENQTLEVAFNSLKSTVTTTTNTVTSQGTSISTIQGQIQAKIWQQDIDTLEDSLDTRIKSTETSITALNNSISLKVSTSDFTTYQGTVTSSLNSKANQSALNTTNGNVTALTTRVTSAESSISVLQNQISLKVEQTDITTAIKNVQVGVRNILFASGTLLSTKFSINLLTLTENGYMGNTVGYYDNSSAASGYKDILRQSILGRTEDGEWYTFSFYSKGNGKLRTHIYPTTIDTTVNGFVDGVEETLISDGTKDWTLTDSWVRHTYTFKQRSYNRTSADVLFRLYFGNSVYICMPKLEKGTKVSDWSPAPEDSMSYTDTQISTAKAEIKVTTDSISSTISSVQSSVTSLGTRVTSAESSITSLNNSITLKVNTSDFNSYKTSNDSAVNSLTSRISSAELKITDSAIVSTVRSSTAYTNDLSAKANQSSVTNLTTRVTSTESSITQLSTQIQSKVNQGDFGTLITQNVSSVRIAVGQIGGTNLLRDSGFELEYSTVIANSGPIATWGIVTNAHGVNPINGSKKFLYMNCFDRYGDAYVETNMSVSVRAGQTYTVSYDYICAGTISGQSSYMWIGSNAVALWSSSYVADQKWHRMVVKYTATTDTTMRLRFGFIANNAWLAIDNVKIEEGDNSTAYSPNPNEASNVSVDISDSGLTVRNGAISILNNAGTQVLSGDTSGNLTIRGDFTTYDDSTGNVAIRLSKRTAFFYDWDSNAVCGEIFAGKIVGNITTRGMVFGAYRNKFLQVSYQGSDNNMYPVIAVDNGAFGSAGTVTITGGKQISTQNLYVSGSKNCIQDTENYGKRLLYAYETTESYLGDFVHGKINENGECVISIDEIFGECVNTEIQYHVFTQTYKGSISEIELYPNYFIVKGEAGTSFSCEIKARRKGFEHVRLEQKFVEEHGVESIEDELKSLVSSDIDEELYGDLADELLEV